MQLGSEAKNGFGSPNPLESAMETSNTLHFQLLGDLSIHASGREIVIPPSRKTRALLAYLLLSGVPQRRERLCELFWDIPDDPRGALRWSLSKLRGIVSKQDASFLVTDRERVSIDQALVTIDVREHAKLVEDTSASFEQLEKAWMSCQKILLQDCDIPRLVAFSSWLERERLEVTKLRSRLVQRLAGFESVSPDDAVRWADAWLEDAPRDSAAAIAAVGVRLAAGRIKEADLLRKKLHVGFVEAKLPIPEWPEEGATGQSSIEKGRVLSDEETDRALRSRQRVRFAQASDGARLAWATVGAERGPPLVKAANWLSHLELDWEAPIWSPLFRDLAQSHCLIRYDERGCGLSDWDVADISLDAFVTDLETVVDAAGLDRFPLLGISQGAAVSIEYAARHPERVSHLILFGGYAAGWRHVATAQEAREREAIMVLTEAGWGRDDASYRHLFTRSFMPDATPEELAWFDDFQRQTTSPRNAVRFLDAFSKIDVRDRLSRLHVPTLILHSRDDHRIPVNTGRELAAAIPGAEFVVLSSANHLLLGREPASREFLRAIRSFLDG